MRASLPFTMEPHHRPVATDSSLPEGMEGGEPPTAGQLFIATPAASRPVSPCAVASADCSSIAMKLPKLPSYAKV